MRNQKGEFVEMQEEKLIGTLTEFVRQSAVRVSDEEGDEIGSLGVTSHKDVVFLSISRSSALHLSSHIDARDCPFAKKVQEVLFMEGFHQ